ncbi:hypothetical protein GPECTOR_77g1 [Gonium pectorale]|uniref:Uncharacterized protein n=1 Tax=Gonium pectorale TaxID=33097 RepID=A0A150G218_GONPE|nr:hypothetical protein GPECTOR_77g1 [Gonium pectorale]|eukprot:KXZ43912.1 hypothetical protein GPECTOR_77g1 [Gonium pectorale]
MRTERAAAVAAAAEAAPSHREAAAPHTSGGNGGALANPFLKRPAAADSSAVGVVPPPKRPNRKERRPSSQHGDDDRPGGRDDDAASDGGVSSEDEHDEQPVKNPVGELTFDPARPEALDRSNRTAEAETSGTDASPVYLTRPSSQHGDGGDDDAASDGGRLPSGAAQGAATAQALAAQAQAGAAPAGAAAEEAATERPATEGPATEQLPHIKPDPEPLPAGEARYSQLAGLAFDAAELAELRQHYLQPCIPHTSRAPNNGRLRRSTQAKHRVSRAQLCYGVLWPHLDRLAKQVDREQGEAAAKNRCVASGRKRKCGVGGGGSVPAMEAPGAVRLLRALRTLRMYEICTGISPNLPLYTLGRLLPGLAERLRAERGDVEEATEVVDLTAADDNNVIDVEAYVVEFLIVREVKVEPGGGGAVTGVVVKEEPGGELEPAGGSGHGGGGGAAAAMAATLTATVKQEPV